MSKKKTWIFAIILLVTLGVVVQMFKTTISPENIMIAEAVVSDSSITLRGDIAASAVSYKTYTVEQIDGKLFVKIKGSSLNLTKPNGSFDISIENTFGKINGIYLQGSSSSDTRLIWPAI